MGQGVGLVYDERMCAHKNECDQYHPESPRRIKSIYNALKSAGVVKRCVQVPAREATPDELKTVHTGDHVTLMKDISKKSFGKTKRKRLQDYYDSIYFNEGSSGSSLLAAGSVIEVAVQVAEGKLAAGACVVRPPGHHAEADQPMGFCLFNNVAIAAHILAHQKQELGMQKILLVDWDVHHGNGTQHMFWTDPQVLYFSVHRFDNGKFYPPGNDGNYTEIGGDKGEGFNINVPWPKEGFGDGDYLAVWEHILMPVAREFEPDIVLISAGFDSAVGDPLGRCKVTPGGYFQMTLQLMELAKGRVVLALEGGYNLDSIAKSYLTCVQALLGDPSPVTEVEHTLLPDTLPLLEKVRNHLQDYWPVLKSQMKPLCPVPPAPAPSLTAEEIRKLVLEDEEPSAVANEREGQLPSQPAIMPITDLVGLLSRLSTWEGNSDATDDDPTSSTVVTQEVRHTVEKEQRIESAGETSFMEVPREHLEMKEIANDDIEVILQLSGADSSSPADEGDSTGQVVDGVEVERTMEPEVIRGRQGTDDRVSSDLSTAGEVPTVPDVKESSYIWYACYGSNLWEPRFMCYIKGGKVECMSRSCFGCRDKTPPVASGWLTIPNRLFFGHESTRMWGLGGVAFIDPVSEAGISTHIRIYKITMEQFNDVISQENPGRVEKNWLTGSHIDMLRKAPPHHLCEIFEDEWYGTVKYLGEKDGLPILTFTCPESHMDKFRSGEFGTFSPPDSYRTVVVNGLVEDLGMSQEQAHDYVSSAILPK